MELTRHQIETVYKYAMRSLMAGKSREALIEDLVKRQIPEEKAEELVDKALKAKHFQFRKHGFQDMLKAMAFLISGIIIMSATLGFEESSAKLIITWGLMVMGGVFLLRGLYRIIAG